MINAGAALVSEDLLMELKDMEKEDVLNALRQLRNQLKRNPNYFTN